MGIITIHLIPVQDVTLMIILQRPILHTLRWVLEQIVQHVTLKHPGYRLRLTMMRSFFQSIVEHIRASGINAMTATLILMIFLFSHVSPVMPILKPTINMAEFPDTSMKTQHAWLVTQPVMRREPSIMMERTSR